MSYLHRVFKTPEYTGVRKLRPTDGAVSESAELRRIVALPRRPAPLYATKPEERAEASATVIEHYSSLLRRPNTVCRCGTVNGAPKCITRLLEAQAWALYELEHEGRLAGSLGVGSGKTGIGILAPMVIPNCKVAVLLVSAELRSQFAADFEAWSEHWHVPNLAGRKNGYFFPDGRPVLEVVSYSVLSRPESSQLLERLNPDVIIADESDKLGAVTTATTGRFLNFMEAHPRTRFLQWSGTPASRSISDNAHLLKLGLQDFCPVPRSDAVLTEWKAAIDPIPWKRQLTPMEPGALLSLCKPGEDVRTGFCRRVVETPGYLATSEASVAVDLFLHERRPPVPPKVIQAVSDIRQRWRRPDGDELVEILEVTRCASEMCAGFYYRWRWHGETVKDIEEWLDARKAYNAEVRLLCQQRRPELDSPALCEAAALRYYGARTGEPDGPVWQALPFPRWDRISRRVQHPETEPVWVDEFLVSDAMDWAHEHRRGIIWYLHDAFGQALARRGVPVYGAGADPVENLKPTPEMEKLRAEEIRKGAWEGGENAANWIKCETGKRIIAASIKAHGRGRNLQMFTEHLVANVPGDGKIWEQLLGRAHRTGQDKPVHVWVYRHMKDVRDALDNALILAEFAKTTSGQMQRLCLAHKDF